MAVDSPGLRQGQRHPDFTCRVVYIDYYMRKPVPGLDVAYSQLQGAAVEQVPVVRIFGSTPAGQKTCAHIRKAFPYFYVPYREDLPLELSQVQGYLRRMAHGIDNALHAASEPGAVRKQRVHTVHLVRACDFYGYHAEERFFMKIIMYHPMDVARASKLLQDGAVFGQPLQPYEAHIPFLLQFKIDFNLYGMGHLRFVKVRFRAPVPAAHSTSLIHHRPGWWHKPTVLRHEPGTSAGMNTSSPSGSQGTLSQQTWTTRSIPNEWLHTAAPGARMLERESCCELELDGCVEDILNRHELERRSLAVAGPEVRMVESLAPMWDEQRARNNGATPLQPPAAPPRTPLTLSPFVTDAIRAQYQVLADAHQAAVPAQGASQGQQAASDASKASSSSLKPSAREPLMQVTQAANLATDPATSSSGLGPASGDGPLHAQDSTAEAPAQAAQLQEARLDPARERQLERQARGSYIEESNMAVGRRAHEQEGRLLGQMQSPFSPTKAPGRGPPQGEPGEVRELLEWLEREGHDSDHASDEELDDGDALMRLAHQAATPFAPSVQPQSSQQEALRKRHSAMSGRMSQTQRECDDIMDLATPAGQPHLAGLGEASPPRPHPHSFYSPPSSSEDEEADPADAPQQNFDQRADAAPASAARQHHGSSSQDIDKARRSMDAEFLRRAGSVQATPRRNPTTAAAMSQPAARDLAVAQDVQRVSLRGMGRSRGVHWAEQPDDMRDAEDDTWHAEEQHEGMRDIEDAAAGRLATGVFALGTPTPRERAWDGLSLDLEALSQDVPMDWVEQVPDSQADEAPAAANAPDSDGEARLSLRIPQVDGPADEPSQSSARSASHATGKRGRARRRGNSKPVTSNMGSLNLQSSQPSPGQAPSQLHHSQSQLSDAAADNSRRAAVLQHGDTAQSGVRSNNNMMRDRHAQQAAQHLAQSSSQQSMQQPTGMAATRGVRAPFRPPRQSSAELQQGSMPDAGPTGVHASAGVASDASAGAKRKPSRNEALLRLPAGTLARASSAQREQEAAPHPQSVPSSLQGSAYARLQLQAALRSQSPAPATGGSAGLHRSRADIHRLSLMSQATRGMFKGSSSDDTPLNAASSPDAVSPEQPRTGAVSAQGLISNEQAPSAQAPSEAAEAAVGNEAQRLHTPPQAAVGSEASDQPPVGGTPEAGDGKTARAAVAQAATSQPEAAMAPDRQPGTQPRPAAAAVSSAASPDEASYGARRPAPSQPHIEPASSPEQQQLCSSQANAQAEVQPAAAAAAHPLRGLEAAPTSPHQSARDAVAHLEDQALASPVQPSSSGTDHSLVLSIGTWGSPQKPPVDSASPQSKHALQLRAQPPKAERDSLPVPAKTVVPKTVDAPSQLHEAKISADEPRAETDAAQMQADRGILSQQSGDPSSCAAQPGSNASDQGQRSSDVNISSSHAASPLSMDHAAVHASQNASPQGRLSQPVSPLQMLSMSQQQQGNDRPATAQGPAERLHDPQPAANSDLAMAAAELGTPSQQFSLRLPTAGDNAAEGMQPAASAVEPITAAGSQASRQHQQPADTGQPAAAEGLAEWQAGSAESHQASPKAGWHRYAHPPPSQADLLKSAPQHGIDPIVHLEPFYGNPSDAPARPTVFAGLEFRVPVDSIANLPAFGSGASSLGLSAMEQAAAANRPLQAARQGTGRRVWMTPALRPPIRAETDAWLAHERAGQAQPSRADAQSSEAEGSGFVMDPNTGKLVPVREQAADGAASGSQANANGSQASELWGTPALGSALHAEGRTPLKMSRLAIASQPEDPDPFNQEDEIRPASPKYDERSFFYTTPALHPKSPPSKAPASPMPPPAPRPPSQPQTSTTGKPPTTPQQSSDSAARARTPQVSIPDTPMPPAGAAASILAHKAVGGQAPSPWATPMGRAALSHHPETSTGSKRSALETRPEMPGHAWGPQEVQPAAKRAKFVSQITPPSPAKGAQAEHTPVSQAGFKRIVAGKGQQLTLLSLEVHADCRGSLLPDPRYDAVRCIVMAVMDDDEDVPDGRFTARALICDGEQTPLGLLGIPDVQMERYETEEAMLDALVEAVRALDPDILLGWEVQQGSLGYLVDRAALTERPLLQQLSRTPKAASPKDRQTDEYGQLHASGLHSAGRIILNMWRIMRSELKLPIYTFEACVAALLQLRTPHIPAWALSAWFTQPPKGGGRWRCLKYWIARARLSLAMLEQLDLAGRTGELARTFGIDFESVLTRGSQYRVESMLVRLAHTQNYLMLSPSREQVARQPAMEAIPLVMEPESRFYADPVIVLDFQSLYPSIVIAYNLCFSTCIGRPAHVSDDSPGQQLGCSCLNLPPAALQGALAPEKLNVAANAATYAPPEARPGILPRLLREILDTRIMVKAAMKAASPKARVLQRLLNARQFGLKLIANVTYGYTAAGFSGRMPMAELADSIVQNARSTLENAIQMVESHPDWRARVVYGDTDSLFVLLKGRSRAAAFKIGAEIASSVTAANPSPVTLKMEKVYHPSVLVTKKRYVGMMFENPKQTEPDFDAKGIETVRRDTCPAVAKTMERCLRTLFASRDLSQVRAYIERQWDKILAGRISVADFVFAKEVRLGTYSGKPGAVAPPAAIVAAHAMARDPRAEPRFAERVPYVVVYGAPGARLVDMVVPPGALIAPGSQLRLHALYYITKQIIPALERLLSLVGADIRAWFTALPRPQRLLPQKRVPRGASGADAVGVGGMVGTGRATLAGSVGGTIDRYYLSRHCAVCDALTLASAPLCEQCTADKALAAAVLAARAGRLERAAAQLVRICQHCGGGGSMGLGGVACDSLDCGLFFERQKTRRELSAALALQDAGLDMLE